MNDLNLPDLAAECRRLSGKIAIGAVVNTDQVSRFGGEVGAGADGLSLREPSHACRVGKGGMNAGMSGNGGGENTTRRTPRTVDNRTEWETRPAAPAPTAPSSP